jgi:[acyl-carrier-protein] S-malonyltransferase
MPIESPRGPVALVFPGQGAQAAEMLHPFRALEGFDDVVATVSTLLGFDPIQAILRDPAVLRENSVSSLMTVAASVLALRQWRAANPDPPIAVAGYSVGQWTALYAADVIDEATLFGLVAARARLMDAALSNCPPSGMIGVIGLAFPMLEDICNQARSAGHVLEITNYNAPGQFTLGGDEPGLVFGEAKIHAMKPRRVMRLPVAGAWHGVFMRPVVEGLVQLIRSARLHPPRVPVIDNISGGFIAESFPVETLAGQVAAPVRWMQGIATLSQRGARSFVEVGYGDVLTRFGFFIDRGLRHVALAPPSRVKA